MKKKNMDEIKSVLGKREHESKESGSQQQDCSVFDQSECEELLPPPKKKRHLVTAKSC